MLKPPPPLKEDKEKRHRKLLKGGVLASGITGMVTRAKADTPIKAKDSGEIYNKLLNEAKSQGIKVVNSPELGNSYYTGMNAPKFYIDQRKKDLSEKLRKLEKEGNEAKLKKFKSKYTKELIDNLGEDAVVLGGKNIAPDSLAHELGHAQYLKKGRSKSIIGKVSHSAYGISKLGSSGVVSLANGIHSGIKAAKAEHKGEKESKWNRAKSAVIPAALAVPVLVSEGKASLNGLRRMKKLGASEKLMKESKRNLGYAYGTYLNAAGRSVLSGEIGREAGKRFERWKQKRQDKKEHPE